MGSVAAMSLDLGAAEASAMHWSFRHLYLHLPGDVALAPELWADALRREMDLRGIVRPVGPITSLLVTGAGAAALEEALVPFVRDLLGWNAGSLGGPQPDHAPVASWTLELDLQRSPNAPLHLWWEGGIHRLALRPLPLGSGPWLAGLGPPPGKFVSTTLDLNGADALSLVAEARAHQGAGVVSIAFTESEGRDGGHEVFLALRHALTSSGWQEGDLAFFHAPQAFLPAPRSIRRREPVLGLGPGAVTFRHPWRRWNPADPASYLQAVQAGLDPRGGAEVLDPTAARLERLWHALRTPEGLRCPGLQRGDQATERAASGRGKTEESLATWTSLGYLAPHPNRVVLTSEGQLRLDALVVALARALEADGLDVPRRTTKL